MTVAIKLELDSETYTRLAEQAERIGHLEADLAAARAQLVERAEATSANGRTHEDAAPDLPERRRWWRWLWE